MLAVLPAGLVPLAWGFTAAVAAGTVGERPLTIGLGVMAVLFAVFAAQSAMAEGALADWRLVILGGLVVNGVALVDLLVLSDGRFVPIAAYGWMLLPVPALVRTGRAVGASTRYLAFGGLSVLGAAVVGVAAVTGGVAGMGADQLTLAGLVFVAAGQTGSILDAVTRNDGGLNA